MTTKAVIFLSLVFMYCSNVYSQSSTAFDGRVTVGDENAQPENGAIRYNAQNGTFEGYTFGNWVRLSPSCTCPYVITPFTQSQVTVNNTTVSITIEFSHRMSPSSFIYGDNLIIKGIGGGTTSTSGSLTWSNHNTRLVIVPSEQYDTIVGNCFQGFSLTLAGDGENPIRGINLEPLDGDRDGCCGGEYVQNFVTIC